MRGRGYASQSEPGGPYLLGPAVLEAAFTFHAGLDLRRLLHSLAAKVRDHFRQTCHVVVLDGAQVSYIDKVEAIGQSRRRDQPDQHLREVHVMGAGPGNAGLWTLGLDGWVAMLCKRR